MQSIVFKQRYKPLGIPTTPVLNQKHLEYIATRRGAVKNPGCGFGLWGCGPGKYEPENIQSLDEVKKLMGKVSKRRTVYRVVLSVDDETAKAKGMYSRSTWETLMEERIKYLAQAMNIRAKNFCWYASMHYKKGHPHVHVMYWDNGNDPRVEHIPPARFEKISESVRAGFNGGIFREELREQQKIQQETVRTLRFDLREWFTQSNAYEALNLDRVSNQRLDMLCEEFADLVKISPNKGSLKYSYLSPDFKKKVDSFVEKIFEIPQLSAQRNMYRKASAEICSLYGNGAKATAENLGKAEKTLNKAMANETLAAIRNCLREMKAEYAQAAATYEEHEVRQELKDMALKLLRADTQYEALLKKLPKWRTPFSAWKPEDQKQYHMVRANVWSDKRMQSLRSEYVKVHGLNPEETERLWKQWGDDLSGILYSNLREQMGYDTQLFMCSMTELLIESMRTVSQNRHQTAHQLHGLKRRRGDLSREERAERKKRLEQAGSWEQEL